ncbi:MAG: hypothetical protein FWG56_11465 [Desulfovibrionaceae bacterium]|jgi:hypothetical protein|nr:hypothetical protein [Desulfovibrionaceae bacterium]
MDVSAVTARLKGAIQGVMEISGAADLAAAMRGHARPPAIYVMPAADQAQGVDFANPCGAAGGRLQLISVITVVDELGDPVGDAALRGLPAIRRQIEACLAGWQPPQLSDPVQFVSGEVAQFEGDGLLWWADTYGYVRYGAI